MQAHADVSHLLLHVEARGCCKLAGALRNVLSTTLAQCRQGCCLQNSLLTFFSETSTGSLELLFAGCPCSQRTAESWTPCTSLHWHRCTVPMDAICLQVALFSENGTRWLLADQAVMLNGAADAVRGASGPASELAYILRHSGSTTLITQVSTAQPAGVRCSSASRVLAQPSCCLGCSTFVATHRSPCSQHRPAQSRQEALHVQQPAAWAAQQDGST